jgi:GR25 family glycosyltransferase involved in LPS biosynthesis
MKSFVITIKGNQVSETASAHCIESSKDVGNGFDIEVFDAITPPQVNKLMRDYRIQWNYPWEGEVFDFKTGLKKTAYPTVNKDARIACALSHYALWRECLLGNETLLILEHDAKFIKKLDFPEIERSKYHIVGINNPLFATRKSQLFKKIIDESNRTIILAPTIDSYEIPQGIAGNSAYVMKPKGAEKMLKLVEEHGLWPNDALMCRQLVPMLGVTKTFYTEVQGTPSTTSR